MLRSLVPRAGRATAAAAVVVAMQTRSSWSYSSILDLERIDRDIFRTADVSSLWHPPGSRGLYGGQVIGQATRAAHETLDPEYDHHLHSLHAYFLKPGSAAKPLVFNIQRLMDGRSFCSRSVTVVQDGTPVAQVQASFQVPEESPLEYFKPMPEVPPPDDLVSVKDVLTAAASNEAIPKAARAFLESALSQPFPLEVRHVDTSVEEALAPLVGKSVKPRKASQKLWMRAVGELGSSQHTHRCILAWLSDWGLTTTPLLAAGLRLYSPALAMIASIDHALWFHEPFRVDDWLLYDMSSDFAKGGRGVTSGRIYGQDGRLKASVVQEGLIRIRDGVTLDMYSNPA